MPAAIGAVGVLLIGVVAALLLASHGGHPRPGSPVSLSPQAPVGRVAVPAPAGVTFGASVNSLFNYSYYTPSQVDAELSALRQTGATVGRSDALWEATELAPPVAGVHHYRWNFDDRIAASLAAQGLRWLPIIDYSADWAKAIPRQLHSPPRSARDFAAFAAALAARYGPGGAFWRDHPRLTPRPVDTYEIWNEPDGVFWFPSPNAAAYTTLYLLARNAIQSVAAGSHVLVGGLAHPLTFLPAMLAARRDLAAHLDGVAIHPYAPRPRGVLAAVEAIRALMDASALTTVPLYVTEIGWSTRPPHSWDWAPARIRPKYLSQTLTALGRSNCGVAAIVLYAWTTPQRNPTDFGDWYGISPPPPHMGSTPDVQAFAGALRATGGPAPRKRLCAVSVAGSRSPPGP